MAAKRCTEMFISEEVTPDMAAQQPMPNPMSEWI